MDEEYLRMKLDHTENEEGNVEHGIQVIMRNETPCLMKLHMECRCCQGEMIMRIVDMERIDEVTELFKALHTTDDCNAEVYKRKQMVEEL